MKEKWHYYLMHWPFIIKTDQYSLKYVLSRNKYKNLTQWAYKLLGFNFEIEYKPEKSNAVGDALLRAPLFPDLQELQVSRPQSLHLTTIKQEVQQDPRNWKIMTDKEVNSILHLRYQVHRGMLFYQGRLALTHSLSLK